MLANYAPDDCDWTPRQCIRHKYVGYYSPRITDRGSIRGGGTYYTYETSGDEHTVLSVNTIADSIDYSTLPDEHPYRHSPSGAGHRPDERTAIREYARIRGILLHNIILDEDIIPSEVGIEDIRDRTREEIKRLPPDITPEAIQRVVASWKGAPLVPAPSHTDGTPTDAIATYATQEAYRALDNWHTFAFECDTTRITDEAPVIGETDDGHGYAGQIDRLAAIEDSPLPDALYVVEFKLSDEIHPRHLVQAEAYRRTIVDDYEDIAACVIRVGIEDGDRDIVTSYDDAWQCDVLWDMFSRRTASLYDDPTIRAALDVSGR